MTQEYVQVQIVIPAFFFYTIEQTYKHISLFLNIIQWFKTFSNSIMLIKVEEKKQYLI
jgi:hypothetical protein